jgi:hypothetical protein
LTDSDDEAEKEEARVEEEKAQGIHEIGDDDKADTG